MARFYYLDIESNGINPQLNDIVTIQYQPLNEKGEACGELIILKSWESSEKEIVEKFYKIFVNTFIWDFIPIMQNGLFDFTFLLEKFRKYNLPIHKDSLEFIFTKPYLDIRTTLIIANDMQFKNSGLDKMTFKESDGRNIPIWFAEKEYDKIIQYIQMETTAFIKAFQIIIEHQKDLKGKLKNG